MAFAGHRGTDAARLYRDLGDRHGEGVALEELGAARQLARDYNAAAQICCDLRPEL